MRTLHYSKNKIRFQISIVLGVLLIVGLLTFSIVAMTLSVARVTARESADTNFKAISLAARERTGLLLRPAMDTAFTAAYMPGVNSVIHDDGLMHPSRILFTRILQNKPAFYSIYIGLADGSFFQVIKAGKSTLVNKAHEAPENTDFIIRTISGQGKERIQIFTFLDQDGNVTGGRRETDFSYDPRQRQWYKEAAEYKDVILSDPYIFNSLKQPGITAACAINGGGGVAGVDLTISSLSSFVTSQKISDNGGIALLTENLDIIASSPGSTAMIDEIFKSKGKTADSLYGSDNIIDENILIHTEEWKFAVNNTLYFFSSAPLSDFMSGAVEMRRKILLISVFILIITIPFVVLWSRRLAKALKELAGDAEKIGQFNFDGKLSINTSIYEFNLLARGFDVMKVTIAQRTEELKQTLIKLQMLVDMSIAMSAEFDINRLSEMILSGAKKLTNADGGSLYLVDQDRTLLEFKIVLNDTLNFRQGGTSGVPVIMKAVPLYDTDGSENHHNVVTHTFHTGKTENIADAYEIGKYDFSGTRAFDRENNYRSVSFLTVPLKPRGGGKVLGALQLINARSNETGEIIPFPENIRNFVEALSSAAAVAVQNWGLMERQKRLFDDLVRFVAIAIDAKSPYTARHCERVPEIVRILAREAEKVQEGPLASFRFENTDQQREFEVAAWLHDCGKVTTPEYVVDKATKLETIYNRIHEIRTRFEVLLRDARIKRHEAVLEGKDKKRADQELAEQEMKLHSDYAFVAECNIGSEFMDDQTIERLKEIASTAWYRHFNDRIGLSWGEKNRLEALGESLEYGGIPVRESLINDRPEHIIPRENWTRDYYSKYGFNFKVPEHLYNRGELYNLSVRKGTLTVEERFKIDEHVAQTIVMLEQLPFPEELKKVPWYAGIHHELPDGSGYPRRLKESGLSIPDRIMAISDIFEALTSSDRPYKKAHTLSEAIEILYSMKNQHRVDPDLFNLLLYSAAYREYAEKFLQPIQIDSVDVSKYL